MLLRKPRRKSGSLSYAGRWKLGAANDCNTHNSILWAGNTKRLQRLTWQGQHWALEQNLDRVFAAVLGHNLQKFQSGDTAIRRSALIRIGLSARIGRPYAKDSEGKHKRRFNANKHTLSRNRQIGHGNLQSIARRTFPRRPMAPGMKPSRRKRTLLVAMSGRSTLWYRPAVRNRVRPSGLRNRPPAGSPCIGGRRRWLRSRRKRCRCHAHSRAWKQAAHCGRCSTCTVYTSYQYISIHISMFVWQRPHLLAAGRAHGCAGNVVSFRTTADRSTQRRTAL